MIIRGKIRARIPFRFQRRAAFVIPGIAENAAFGGAGLFLSQHLPLESAWGMSMFLVAAHIIGTWWPSIKATAARRQLSFVSYSWSSGAMTAAFTTLLLFVATSREVGTYVLFAGGLILVLCYAVVKLRCCINRCCEAARVNGQLAVFFTDWVPLHMFESIASFFNAIVGIWLTSISMTGACAAVWMGHLCLRILNRYLRSRDMRLRSLAAAEHFAIGSALTLSIFAT